MNKKIKEFINFFKLTCVKCWVSILIVNFLYFLIIFLHYKKFNINELDFIIVDMHEFDFFEIFAYGGFKYDLKTVLISSSFYNTFLMTLIFCLLCMEFFPPIECKDYPLMLALYLTFAKMYFFTYFIIIYNGISSLEYYRTIEDIILHEGILYESPYYIVTQAIDPEIRFELAKAIFNDNFSMYNYQFTEECWNMHYSNIQKLDSYYDIHLYVYQMHHKYILQFDFSKYDNLLTNFNLNRLNSYKL